jgi:hypothetical protein
MFSTTPATNEPGMGNRAVRRRLVRLKRPMMGSLFRFCFGLEAQPGRKDLILGPAGLRADSLA